MDNDDQRRARFLERLAATANVTESCEAADIPRSTAYLWRKQDATFAKAWEEANDLGSDALEDEAVRRGRVGVLDPVFYQGIECGSVRRYSDTLLIFMLKGRRPDRFKDRVSAEHSGPGGGPLVTEITYVHHAPAPDPEEEDAAVAPERPAVDGSGAGREGAGELPPGPDAGVE